MIGYQASWLVPLHPGVFGQNTNSLPNTWRLSSCGGSLTDVKGDISVDVFEYRDYRRFLSDVYALRKKSEYGFSYRTFSRRAQICAPNFLKLVTDGTRNLSAAMAPRFAAALGLEGKSAAYFCDLVAFNQARSALEKEHQYKRLQSYKKDCHAFLLDAAHVEYHSEWYIPAIRELAATSEFRDDPKWVSRTLRPRISIKQSRHALVILKRIGLLRQNESGNWEQSEPLVATPDDSLGHSLALFHRAMLQKASEALDRFPREEREFGALTLALDEETAKRFKTRLVELREELLQDSLSASSSADRVFQINLHLFPLSESTRNQP